MWCAALVAASSNESLEGKLCGACWEGRLCVDSEGDAFPCVFSKFVPVGNVRTQQLSDLVADAPLNKFRHLMFEDRVCDTGEKCRPGPGKPGSDDSGDEPEETDQGGCQLRPWRPGSDSVQPVLNGCRPGPCNPG